MHLNFSSNIFYFDYTSYNNLWTDIFVTCPEKLKSLMNIIIPVLPQENVHVRVYVSIAQDELTFIFNRSRFLLSYEFTIFMKW